jgi:hypothetical protein
MHPQRLRLSPPFSFALTVLLSAALAACGGAKAVKADGLAACLGGQTGTAGEDRREATFPALAARARGFIKTFQFDSDAGKSFHDATPTELYVMADEDAAKQAVIGMARAVHKPGQADLVERRHNLLLAFAEMPSSSQLTILNGCLKAQQAAGAGARTQLWTKAMAAAYAKRERAKRLAAVRADPAGHYRNVLTAMVQNCLLGNAQSGWPGRWYGTTNESGSNTEEDNLWETDRLQAFDIRPWNPDLEQAPEQHSELPAAPRVEIVLIHPEYSGASASDYIRQASEAQDSGFSSTRLKMRALAGDQGVLIYDPSDRPPSAQQIADAGECYRAGADRFQQMLVGRRDLEDLDL